MWLYFLGMNKQFRIFAAISCCLCCHTDFFLSQSQHIYVDHQGAHGAHGFWDPWGSWTHHSHMRAQLPIISAVWGSWWFLFNEFICSMSFVFLAEPVASEITYKSAYAHCVAASHCTPPLAGSFAQIFFFNLDVFQFIYLAAVFDPVTSDRHSQKC